MAQPVADSTAMMATVIMSSTRVKPLRWSCRMILSLLRSDPR